MFQTTQVQNVEEVEGILFKDIRHLLNNKNNFENVLFTGHIIFLDNDELVEFINKLMEFGYENMAFDYLENIHNKITIDYSKFNKYENSFK